jgi:hypothetical protein
MYKPETEMLPTVFMSPPFLPFTCQFTAELPAFCTVAVNCTVVPVNGCAEAGDTVIMTGGGGGGGGGGPEDTRPPQEIRNIASSGERRKRNERRERSARDSIASCGW